MIEDPACDVCGGDPADCDCYADDRPMLSMRCILWGAGLGLLFWLAVLWALFA